MFLIFIRLTMFIIYILLYLPVQFVTPLYNSKDTLRQLSTELSPSRFGLEAGLETEASDSSVCIDEENLPWNTPEFKRYGMVGRSRAIRELFNKIEQVVNNDLTSPVLIHGPTGTGKELTMQAMHRLNKKRCNGPLVIVNVNELPQDDLSNLSEALFGRKDRDNITKGLFEAADGGYIVFDEIADANKDLQGMLLRVIESNSIRRVNDYQQTSLNIRIIAITNKDPQKVLRNDLAKRFVFRIEAPDIYERSEADVILIAEYYNLLFSKQYGVSYRPIEWAAAIAFYQYYLHASPAIEGKGKDIRDIISAMENIVAFSGTPEFEEFLREHPASKFLITIDEFVRVCGDEEDTSDFYHLLSFEKECSFIARIQDIRSDVKWVSRFIPYLSGIRKMLPAYDRDTLTYKQLLELIQKPDYLLDIGIPCLYHKSKEEKGVQQMFFIIPEPKEIGVKFEEYIVKRLKQIYVEYSIYDTRSDYEPVDKLENMKFRIREVVLPNGKKILYVYAIPNKSTVKMYLFEPKISSATPLGERAEGAEALLSKLIGKKSVEKLRYEPIYVDPSVIDRYISSIQHQLTIEEPNEFLINIPVIQLENWLVSLWRCPRDTKEPTVVDYHFTLEVMKGKAEDVSYEILTFFPAETKSNQIKVEKVTEIPRAKKIRNLIAHQA